MSAPLPEPPRERWPQRLLRYLAQRRGSDTIAASVQQSQNVVVGKNIVQIGTLMVPIPLLVAILVALIGGVGLIFWQLNSLAPRGKMRMDGTFNIAIADFTELDARGRPVARSTMGREMSEWVYNSLQKQREDYTRTSDPDNAASLLIWSNSVSPSEKGVAIGKVDAAEPGERQAQAAAIAADIGADAVVYGVFDARGLIPEFYVVPPSRHSILDIVGGYQLGSEPILIDQDDRQALLRQLAPRTNGLFWLLLGLRYVTYGDAEQAYDLLSRAETNLTDWDGGQQGEELLYFFKGQVALFAAQRIDRQQQPDQYQQRLLEAQTAFDRAIQINPMYARVYIGQGSVFLENAEGNENPTQRQDMFTQAIASYEQAKRLAIGTGSQEQVTLLAELGLAQTHRLRGQMYYVLQQDIEAEPELNAAAAGAQTVIDRMTASDNVDYRMLGQAYLTLSNAAQQLGVIRRSQGDPAGSVQWHTRARDTATLCIALRQQGAAQKDDVLRRDVIRGCERVQTHANTALAQMTGEKP